MKPKNAFFIKCEIAFMSYIKYICRENKKKKKLRIFHKFSLH